MHQIGFNLTWFYEGKFETGLREGNYDNRLVHSSFCTLLHFQGAAGKPVVYFGDFIKDEMMCISPTAGSQLCEVTVQQSHLHFLDISFKIDFLIIECLTLPNKK